MNYLDEIKERSLKCAISLKAKRVMPRHLLLAIVERRADENELLTEEGIDPEGLLEVLSKYGIEENDAPSQPEFGAGILELLNRAWELAKKYKEEPGAEFLLWALSESDEFSRDALMQGIGIDWSDIARSMQSRVLSRNAAHSTWSQARISDPGLHKAQIHKFYSDEANAILKTAFDTLRDNGGGTLGLPDVLTSLIESDESGEMKQVIEGAGFKLDDLISNLPTSQSEIEEIVAEGRVGFAQELIDALVEARMQLRAFPADKVEYHHLLLGLLRVGERKMPEVFGELSDAEYGPYQHAAIELIHIRHGIPKLDLTEEIQPEALERLSGEEMREACAVPVKIENGTLIVGTPGYLGPVALKKLREMADMPVEARLAPGRWFVENCGS
jgi:ATP-dependent Clp protease ATP-binding subunit ClpA